MKSRRLHLLLASGFAVAALWFFGSGFAVHAKAGVAQLLITHAWNLNQREGKAEVKPWMWADTTPVARLRFETQAVSLTVLSGDSLRIMAFGPGHSPASPLPGRGGNAVISGHRDTHFAVLQHVARGDSIEVETLSGERLRYAVADMRVVDERDVGVTIDRGADELTLVTCWPFDAVRAGGPLRYVVSARRT